MTTAIISTREVAPSEWVATELGSDEVIGRGRTMTEAIKDATRPEFTIVR